MKKHPRSGPSRAARTVADTRARDVERMERCIAAARELANETSSEFNWTVLLIALAAVSGLFYFLYVQILKRC